MNAETIDHTTLSRLVEAGAVSGAHVVGQPGGWSVLVKYGMAERALAAQRSRQVRVFRRMETLVNYLKDIGIQRFDVDVAEYEAEGGKAHSRPDRAEALRRAHEAAAHDRWFREQVEVALKEADDPDTVWVSNEDAKTGWAKKRAELAQRIAAGDRA
jgi:uncharacterized protein YjiS (DUF1127 family)